MTSYIGHWWGNLLFLGTFPSVWRDYLWGNREVVLHVSSPLNIDKIIKELHTATYTIIFFYAPILLVQLDEVYVVESEYIYFMYSSTCSWIIFINDVLRLKGFLLFLNFWNTCVYFRDILYWRFCPIKLWKTNYYVGST